MYVHVHTVVLLGKKLDDDDDGVYLVGGVPVSSVVAHLSLVDADRAAAGVARLGVERLEAGAAVGPRRTHDVALAAQVRVALEALEVTHVPALALRLRALRREDYLPDSACTAKHQRIHTRTALQTPPPVLPPEKLL